MLNFLLQPEQRRLRIILGATAVVLVTVIWLILIRTPAYVVYVNGQKAFYLKNAQDFDNAIQQMRAEQLAQYNRTLDLHGTVDLKRVFVPRNLLIQAENVAEALSETLNFKLSATDIVINGQHVAYVESETAANQILNDITNQYSQVEEGEKLVAVQVNEDVRLVNEEILVNQLIPQQEAYNLITMGTTAPEEYTVTEGDSLWLIARRNDLYVKDIVQANNLTTDHLKLGQKLILVKTKPYINVAAVVEGDRIEEIPYEVKVVSDSTSSSVRVSQEGEPGEKHIVYQAVKVNGQVESRDIIQETILKQAVDKIMVKGSQLQVASRGGSAGSYSKAVSGSGNLNWPVYGSITQYFSSGHKAVDVSNSLGTSIKAADNGYVTFAGWQGGYGNFVIIDHGNGIVTRYAHCQSIKVSVGQSVKKGEVIATLGSTGRSTGPHVHFEVLSGGAFVNPLNALN